MGNCVKPSQQKKRTDENGQNIRDSPRLLSKFTCPNCYRNFDLGSSLSKFSFHIKSCVINADEPPKSGLMRESVKRNSEEYIYEKVPDNEQGISFSWSRVLSTSVKNQMRRFKAQPSEVKTWPFQEKLNWFRSKLETTRISWEHGCEWIKVHKSSILLSSIQNASKVDMHKEVKILFEGDEVHDAGGLLREWIHLLTKEIFSQQLHLFVRAQTDQLVYKLSNDSEIDQEYSDQILGLFGAVLGKAIFQKIPVCSYLDRTILRQLCGGKITLADVHSYDSGMYESWKFIKNSKIDEDFQLFFSVSEKTGQGIKQIELKEKGAETVVTEENKNQYIDLCIEYYCKKKVEKLLMKIKKTFNQVVPEHYISVFEPFELEMLLYGVPFIDVHDWRQNTEYVGAYYLTHKTILWFWEYIESLPQDKLSKFLQFCTGSGRTPIYGFKKLETNRGNHSKFSIQSRPYNEKDPYPKGHTCFNRFQLPVYPKKQLTHQYLQAILEFETEGLYGLD